MGLYYETQNPVVIIGSKTAAGVTTGVQLESTYGTDESTAPTKSFSTGGASKLSLDIKYTMGATETSNSVQLKIESSPDSVNWYRLPIDTTVTQSTITAREWTFVGTDAAAANINIFLDIAYKYMRISCKESGVASNKGNVFVEALLSGE